MSQNPSQMDASASRTATLVDGFTFPSNQGSCSLSCISDSSVGLQTACVISSSDLKQAPKLENGNVHEVNVPGRPLDPKTNFDNANETPSLRSSISSLPVLDVPYTPPWSAKGLAQISCSVEQEYTPTTLPLQESVFFANIIATPTRNRLTRRRSSQKPSLNLIVEDPSPPSLSARTTCSKDGCSPFEQSDVTYTQHASLDVTSENTSMYEAVPYLSVSKVARRALSMNDLARHENDYPMERKMSLTCDSLLKVSAAT